MEFISSFLHIVNWYEFFGGNLKASVIRVHIIKAQNLGTDWKVTKRRLTQLEIYSQDYLNFKVAMCLLQQINEN